MELEKQGIKASPQKDSNLLTDLGYSMQAASKTLEGDSHPDRNAQFEHINAKVKGFPEAGRARDLDRYQEEGGRLTGFWGRTETASTQPRSPDDSCRIEPAGVGCTRHEVTSRQRERALAQHLLNR